MEYIPLVIGLGLVMAFLASKIFKKVGIPQVVGFIVAGLILRATGIMGPDIMETLSVIVTLALGLIGYNIGLELKVRIFNGRIRRLMVIVVFEATAAFWIVSMLAFFVTQQWYIALLLGALASATAPAATADVVWDHECKGPLSESLMFVLAMDDVIAVVLTNAAIAYALFMLVPTNNDFFAVLLSPIIVTGGSIIIGGVFGIIFVAFVKREQRKGAIVELELALIILLVGIVGFLALSDILAAVVFGFVVGNRVPEDKQEGPQLLEVIMAPIVMLFFVLVGAKTDLSLFVGEIGGLVLLLAGLYLFGRTFGKLVGARVGSSLTDAEPMVKKYLGTCLLSQAGVALGLGIIIETQFVAIGGEAALVGTIILSVVAFSTIILEILGPIAAKWSLSKAGEIGNGDYRHNYEVHLTPVIEKTDDS
ncbi:MAG: cation:proton antiporter [Candidatus Thorarchaeota archaeon]